jgi:hypothetical protein
MRIFVSSTFITLFVCSITMSQVLNPSFEVWTTVNFGSGYEYSYPSNWISTNQSLSKSTIAHSGAYSCLGAVVKSTIFAGDTTSPLLGGRFSMSQHYATLTGYYQFTSANNCTRPYGPSPVPCNDSLTILAIGTIWQGAVIEGTLILGPATTWTLFTVPLTYVPNVYTSGTKPDSITIEIMINSHNIGSYFLIDDLNFEGNVSITRETKHAPAQLSLTRNYPNPFYNNTHIQFTVYTDQLVSLKIFNPIGREVATILDNEIKRAGNYKVPVDLSREPNGLYIFELQIGNIIEAHAMSKTAIRSK